MRAKKGRPPLHHAPHAHPLVCLLFWLMRARRLGVGDVSRRAGLSNATLWHWRTVKSPNLVNFEAAANAAGFELALVDRATGQIVTMPKPEAA